MKFALHLMLSLLLAGSVWANSITQYDPIYDPGAGRVQIYSDFVNDDSGAVYDSYETVIFSNLVTTLWAIPANQISYSNQAAMLDDWSLDISSSGDVQNGWQHDGDFLELEITNVGGIPGVTYDTWTSATSSDMMRLTLNIPLSQLDGDGDGWAAEDPADVVIVEGAPEADVGVAHDGISSYSATANPYTTQQNPQATSNGTSIAWLEGYGFTNDFEGASVGNPDGDAYTTAQEYTLDTNPTNTTPAFELSSPGGPNEWELRFAPSSTGRTYTLWHATRLVNPDWTAGTTVTGSAGSTTFTNVSAVITQYVRVGANRP